MYYKGPLYSVIVTAKILRDSGTTADIVVMVQISYKSNATSLPQDEIDLLTSVGIQIKYLPKFAAEIHENFYSIIMEKFRILEMIEYSRVLFLDSDILPRCHLDYIFEESEPVITTTTTTTTNEGISPSLLLKENVVLSWKDEPGHAGFFLLTPGPNKYTEMEQIIQRIEETSLKLPYPFWDEEIGWGHRFNHRTDYWRSQSGVIGTLWNWLGSFTDQGLIYYWCKYHEQSTSIIIGDDVENWGTNENGVLVLEETIRGSPLRHCHVELNETRKVHPMGIIDTLLEAANLGLKVMLRWRIDLNVRLTNLTYYQMN